MRVRRRSALLLAVVTAAAVLVGGCSDDDANAEGGSVSLLVFGAPEELAAFRTLADGYERLVPGSDVQLIEASDREDLIARLSTSIAGGAPPDVFLMNYRFYGQFAAKGAMEPLDDRLNGSSVIDADDFYPTAMTAFQWGGRQLCMPQNVSSLAVYYNRDLFEKYGVPEPKAGWTWNEFVATAAQLTRDANGRVVSGGSPRVAPTGSRSMASGWSRS
jgi:multiple sugar transport system substrate-binding protein